MLILYQFTIWRVMDVLNRLPPAIRYPVGGTMVVTMGEIDFFLVIILHIDGYRF